ncbi:trifunctional serine/threonine-protein kinase/ATP-binding protein/sensor histidine kinase [Paraburkholderia acidisoli]|uniref:histidine kinase n=1 Tax=Paraburkholderia acidisoli TaxID=2571748 RepID=A0A7Z2JHQ1_9BURK|nr:ATP-binding sensor histidine kinase [Paraburkholderia acidisoli]QGZ64971.1 AAA family ATPase [Paraburkholderia acidisoli]
MTPPPPRPPRFDACPRAASAVPTAAVATAAGFDAAWLARCELAALDESEGVLTQRAYDPVTLASWFVRSAPLYTGAADTGYQRLQREIALAPPAEAAWAAQPVAIFWTPERMACVYAAGPGARLASEAARAPLALATFLEVAVGAARALGEAHAQGATHGEVRPARLLLEGDGSVRLIGLGATGTAPSGPLALTTMSTMSATSAMSAAPGSAGSPGSSAAPLLAPLPAPALAPLLAPGLAPFLAPELARASATADLAKADLYALGVTLYMLLTGALPFSASTAAAWQHAHVAIEPAPPQTLRAEVPDALAAIVLKLMAKDPRDRYGTAASALADLLRSRHALAAHGRIDGFALDVASLSAPLDPGLRLVGRAPEIAQLHAALQRVAQTGAAELVLVGGGPGSGKSALVAAFVDEALRDAPHRALRHAAGKGDARRQNIPYAPVVEIVRALTMAALGASDATLARVRDDWLARLAGQGDAVASLVPEAAHVIGASPPLTHVAAPQAQSRTGRAVLQTFAAFAASAQPGAPLVLFIDDLQWADAATLALLEAFAAGPPANVLLIGAYRDDVKHGEATRASSNDAPAQRLAWLLHDPRAQRRSAIRITRLHARALSAAELGELFALTLDEAPAHLALLAHAVHRKTGGNPFFSWQLLRALMDDGVLAYDVDRGEWGWSESAVANLRDSDNVVDLMLNRLSRLPAEGAALVQQLACIGSRAEAALLARVADTDEATVRARLAPFVEAGLVAEDAGCYAFPHDRVMESAYSMLDAAARPALHARIATILIGCRCQRVQQHVFDICNQIERADMDACTPGERAAFARALIEAGKHARHAAALCQAKRYVNDALALMSASWWITHYELAFSAHVLRCEYLLAQADHETAAREIDALLAKALPTLDKAAVHRLKARLQTVRSDYAGAIETALAGLALLDVRLPREPSRAQLRAGYDAVRGALRGRAIASLGALPASTEPRLHTVMGLLSALSAAFFVDEGLALLHLAKMVELTLEHGATPESPYGLAWFGVYAASAWDAYDDGLAYGLAATALIDLHGYEAARVAALVALDQISAWTRPLAWSLDRALQARSLGRVAGDIGMACYACHHIASDLLSMGAHLRVVEEEIASGLELTRQVQYRDIERILLAQARFARQLSGEGAALAASSPASSPASPPASAALSPSSPVDDDPGTHAEAANSQATRFFLRLYAGMARVYDGDYAAAQAPLAQAAALAWAVPAHIHLADCRLFEALALAHAPGAEAAKTRVLATLGAHRERFAQWARLNALTFRNKLRLLEAEIARLNGNVFAALAAYEQAAEAAAAAGFVHEQALAHEFAGALCAAHGLDTSAREHVRRAAAGYRRWGARRKAAQLAAKWAARFSAADFAANFPADAGATCADEAASGFGSAPAPHAHVHTPNAPERGAAPGWALGVNTARAMSGEVVIDRLIETLMTSVIVHAGAQYGLLLLMRDNGPRIEASARVIEHAVTVTLGSAAPSEEALPLVVLNSVLRTHEPLVLADAAVDAPSLLARAPLRSVLCLPLVRGGALVGVIYLENNLASGVFDAHRIAELEVLAPQLAISLETARLYEQLVEENDRRLAAEVSLRAARAELARTSHVTVLGNLAASIAHEVNQPLTAITASVDASVRWLNRPTPELAEVQTGLANIKRNSVRAAEIIRALRALAKQAPTVFAPLALDPLVRDVLDLLKPELDAQRVRVVVRLAAGDTGAHNDANAGAHADTNANTTADAAIVTGDRVQLQQVVLNLLTNAIEAMSETPVERRVLEIASVREGGEVVVSVRDHGPGIAPGEREAMFAPFYTTKSSGMGMGLAICRSIVEAHRGTLEAHSHGGAELVFRLPLAAAAVSAEAPPSSAGAH